MDGLSGMGIRGMSSMKIGDRIRHGGKEYIREQQVIRLVVNRFEGDTTSPMIMSVLFVMEATHVDEHDRRLFEVDWEVCPRGFYSTEIKDLLGEMTDFTHKVMFNGGTVDAYRYASETDVPFPPEELIDFVEYVMAELGPLEYDEVEEIVKNDVRYENASYAHPVNWSLYIDD